MWTGDSGGFVRTIVALGDPGRYAGHSLRARWRLGTSAVSASAGWVVDDVSLTYVLPPDMTKPTRLTVR